MWNCYVPPINIEPSTPEWLDIALRGRYKRQHRTKDSDDIIRLNDCGQGNVIANFTHDIGHAWGMLHEHQNLKRCSLHLDDHPDILDRSLYPEFMHRQRGANYLTLCRLNLMNRETDKEGIIKTPYPEHRTEEYGGNSTTPISGSFNWFCELLEDYQAAVNRVSDVVNGVEPIDDSK
ncbi:hypothetical protein AJ79_01846 [Helicocarpus griseus UAMH5409]|uniref:Uncharacterized protein n=1 Tax=Helicocarpus griseus UAMH5409 TaxID=1447875 RepID=A0A2B7Y6Q4_9EURO|nr:hypothetical protein AJ79_01846 [Helicocarpus griseus UAMH5409]